MSEIGDNVAVMGDWVPPSPSPSPRAFFSSIAAASADDTGIGELSVGTRKLIMAKGTDSKDAAQTKDAQMAELCSLSDQKLSSRGGLMERIAARAGFNAPRLNTESIRSADLSPNPEIRSPYLTIPPGLSPTTLLDSPVFLSSSLAPSPTTGRFSVLPSGINKSSELVSESADKSKHNFFEGISPTSFAFKPLAEPAPSFFLGAMSKMSPTMFLQHGHPSAEVPVQSESSFLLHGQETIKLESQSRNNLNILAELGRASPKKETGDNTITASQRVFDSNGSTAEHSSPLDEQQDEDHKASAESTIAACGGGGSPSEDGYNWRKYGQKQVKGSEYPRSYYKCTHSSCLVKKKVERSHEGHITEIIYKGAHNHSKPPPGRRSSVGSSNALIDMQLDIPEQIRPHSGADHDSVWANAQKGTTTRTRDWRQDSIIEATSSAYSELRNPPRNQGQNGAHFESRDAVDASPTLSNDEDEDDRATHASVGYDGEEDDSESKRRKIETYPTEMGGATRAIREPRVVVQTTSEVDILDDGYRWRKYGQKVVKGNPNPRSYYKCTSAGCLVRKHVERASHDLKSVITTYEGKHNHDVPAARNSSHANTGQAATASAASVQTHVHRPEPLQVHNPMPTMFDRSAPLASFTLPGRHQMGATPGFSFGMHHHHHSLANLAMAGFRPGQPKMPVMPLHPHLQQQRPINGMGLVLPKGEPKVEPMTEPALDLTNNLSVYQQIMSKLPLGP